MYLMGCHKEISVASHSLDGRMDWWMDGDLLCPDVALVHCHFNYSYQQLRILGFLMKEIKINYKDNIIVLNIHSHTLIFCFKLLSCNCSLCTLLINLCLLTTIMKLNVIHITYYITNLLVYFDLIIKSLDWLNVFLWRCERKENQCFGVSSVSASLNCNS